METIKSFTDLSQSKVLAEILQLESADNVIVSIGDREGAKTITIPKETFNIIRTPFADIKNVIPCWSLAALLNVLPDCTLQINTDGTVFVVCESKKLIIDTCDNPVDTCVVMIEKLHELKML